MNNLFAKAITSSIQANKDKIEKLTKQNLNLKNKNKKLKEENQRLKNIIYTTLEYVDREEVSSVGTPFTSTSIGKEIKELLEGEKTFNSIWKENQRLNNVLNELEKWLKDIIDNNNDRFELYKEDILHNEYQINNIKYQNNILMAILEKLNELKESDK